MEKLLFSLNEHQRAIENLKAAIEKTQRTRNLLDFNGYHKEHLVIKISSRDDLTVNLTCTESGRNRLHGYCTNLKAGYEMILLGAKKLYNEQISDLESQLKDRQFKFNETLKKMSEQ